MSSFYNSKNLFQVIVGIVIALTTTAACSQIPGKKYFSSETRIRVIDAETKEPIEGAIVVANWQTSNGHSFPIFSFELFEVTTDAQGYFELPAWSTTRELRTEALNEEAPEIRIFKPGYLYKLLHNYVYPPRYYVNLPSPVDATSRHNHQEVKLEPVKGDYKLYAYNVSDLQVSLDQIRDTEEGCTWPKFPRMLIAIDKMNQYFQSKGIDVKMREVKYFRKSEECGDPAVIFGDYYDAE